MVNGTIGNISEFSMDEDWCNWYERFEQYIIANEVPEVKETSLFLTLMGKKWIRTSKKFVQAESTVDEYVRAVGRDYEKPFKTETKCVFRKIQI